MSPDTLANAVHRLSDIKRDPIQIDQTIDADLRRKRRNRLGSERLAHRD